jgi:hypothetical protein
MVPCLLKLRRHLRTSKASRRCSAIACALALVAAPAWAQRTEYRDPAGNPNGYTQREGTRSVMRDNAGNPHGYWQQEGDWLAHRDNAGNLLGRQRLK